MAFDRRGFLLAVLVAAAAAEIVGKAAAATYVVGDNLGWSVPSTANEYSSWASRHVFRAGDVLVFNFMTGQHDVAKVTKAAFDGCSSTSPIALSTVGPWNTTLNTTGENFYICTFGSHCTLGQKLAINVTAASSSPTPSPAPMTPTPAPSPGNVAPTPSGSPSPTPSPMPMPGSPTPAPGSAPSMTPGGSPLPGTPGAAPSSMSTPGGISPSSPPPSTSTPGGLSPPSPPAPGSSATVSTISATLVVFASVAFGLTM